MKRTWLSVCVTVVVCKRIPSRAAEVFHTITKYSAVYGDPSSSTYRWPRQPSQRDVTLICVYATRNGGMFWYNCANKHRSCHPFGTGCLWAAGHSASQRFFLSPQLTFISSCVGPKTSLRDPTNCNSCLLVSIERLHGWHPKMLHQKSTVILYFPRAYLYLRCGPTDPH